MICLNNLNMTEYKQEEKKNKLYFHNQMSFCKKEKILKGDTMKECIKVPLERIAVGQ